MNKNKYETKKQEENTYHAQEQNMNTSKAQEYLDLNTDYQDWLEITLRKIKEEPKKYALKISNIQEFAKNKTKKNKPQTNHL